AAQLSADAPPFYSASESQVQDSAGTVFELLSDSLPAGPRLYRFQVLNDALLTIHQIDIVEHTNVFTDVDSIVRGGGETWVYVLVDAFKIDTPDSIYNAWIDPDFTVVYDYSYSPLGSASQMTLDAMLGYALLENSKQSAGDAILATGIGWGTALFGGTGYEFGEGMGYDAAEEINFVGASCTAAQLAFADEAFMIAWEIVKQAGYGLELNPNRPEFVYLLMLAIEEMQQ
ncbi:hypothetical protein JW921_03555, partial [Candidatus Fermentibacterales bacterium]|nr:hypothetical protein [Candidatus Fermentibacterales bacterium]